MPIKSAVFTAVCVVSAASLVDDGVQLCDCSLLSSS